MTAQRALKPQNWHVEGAEAQLGLMESQMGVLWGLSYTCFLEVLPIPTVFHSFLVSQNIYSKTGIEKTVQSVCC